MTTYLEEARTKKKYTPNVVIEIDGDYFAIRQPDSGLSLSSPYDRVVTSLLLNPTQIDIRKVTTTISSFSFRLLDKNGVISALVMGDGAPLIGKEVRIYLGRSNVGMDFSDYFELPRTYINKLDHSDNSYNFSCAEQTERMGRPLYDLKSALGVDILSGTTEWTMRDSIADFPNAGFLKCEDEFVSYSGKDLLNNRFTGVIRGELNSVPAEHSENEDVQLVETVTDNPLNLIMRLLISGGGGGTYDDLQDGLGISNTLIDVAEIEALRDELFSGVSYTVSLYNIASALRYIEEQLLMPNNLRFTNSRNSKLTLAILDKARFVEEDDVIDHDTLTKFPKWSIDGNKVTNIIQVDWDFSEGQNRFLKRNTYRDEDSITTYGEATPLTYQFKGVKEVDGGQELVDDFGSKLLARLSTPTPEVSVNTQIDKSLQTIGDKSYVVSDRIPAADGSLNFASNLEIVSRSINLTNGDVQFKLAFTSFTNIRSGFIAPSDSVVAVLSQKKIQVGAGRAAYYLPGWKMRLFDNVAVDYFADAVNEIAEVDEANDTITFVNDFVTTLATVTQRIRFADYDDAVETQKRYCFLSAGGANFDDGKQTYKVTY